MHPRLAVVLAKEGGALEQLVMPFRLGVGGPLAGGTQWFPWIALDDVLPALHHLLVTESLSGPVNTVAPGIVRQRDFATILGRFLNKPSWLSVPRFALDIRLGSELAGSLIESQRVVPKKLTESGFEFQLPTLEVALRRSLLKR